MPVQEAASSLAIRPLPQPNACEPFSELRCDLWMIDYSSLTALRCHCLASSPSEIRLLVPLGYGIRVGQHYELCAQLPGERPGKAARVIGDACITIASVRILPGGDADEDRVDVRAVRYPLERALRWSA